MSCCSTILLLPHLLFFCAVLQTAPYFSLISSSPALPCKLPQRSLLASGHSLGRFTLETTVFTLDTRFISSGSVLVLVITRLSAPLCLPPPPLGRTLRPSRSCSHTGGLGGHPRGTSQCFPGWTTACWGPLWTTQTTTRFCQPALNTDRH